MSDDRAHPQVVAHRGASADRPENTLEAFRHAVELGADWIELDVRRSADDVLVIHHDAHVGDGVVIVETDYDDLPDSVPTLAEALEAAQGAKVNIEIKNDPDDPDYDVEHQISDAVVGLASAYRPVDELLVSSFNMDTVRRIRAIDPTMPAALLTHVLVMDVDLLIERVVGAGMSAINPWAHTIDRSFVERAHAAGLVINAWTVNDPDRMIELLDAGVDSIITDDVATGRRVVDEWVAATS